MKRIAYKGQCVTYQMRDKRVIKLFLSGKSTDAIAQEMHLSPSWVGQIIKLRSANAR